MKSIKEYIQEGFYQNVGNPWKDWLDKTFPREDISYPVFDDGYHHSKFMYTRWKVERYDDTSIIFKGIDFQESFILDIRKVKNIFSITSGPISVSLSSYRSKKYIVRIHEGTHSYPRGDSMMISFWYDSKKQSAYDFQEWKF